MDGSKAGSDNLCSFGWNRLWRPTESSTLIQEKKIIELFTECKEYEQDDEFQHMLAKVRL